MWATLASFYSIKMGLRKTLSVPVTGSTCKTSQISRLTLCSFRNRSDHIRQFSRCFMIDFDSEVQALTTVSVPSQAGPHAVSRFVFFVLNDFSISPDDATGL
jgi:hypothetical protein